MNSTLEGKIIFYTHLSYFSITPRRHEKLTLTINSLSKQINSNKISQILFYFSFSILLPSDLFCVLFSHTNGTLVALAILNFLKILLLK